MTVFPMSALSLDLALLSEKALSNSVEIERLEKSLIASEIAVDEKWGRLTPTITLSAAHTRVDQNKPVDIEKKGSDYSIGLSQPIYRPNLLLDQQEASLNAEIASVQLNRERENLLKETLSIVFDICRLLSRKMVIEKSMAFVEKTVDIQNRKLTTGYGSRIDLTEAEVELARYHKDDRDLETQINLRLLELEAITGESLETSDFDSITGELMQLSTEWLSRTAEGKFNIAVDKNNQLNLVLVKQKVNQIARNRGYNNLKPQVDLTLKYQQAEEEALVTNRVDEASVELSMSMSFAPVSTYYHVQRQKIEQQVLLIEEAKIKKDLKDAIGRLLRGIDLKKRNMGYQSRWKAKQKILVDMYEGGMKRKHIPFSRFLESSRKYNEAQIDLIQTSFGIWDDRLQIIYLSGDLTIAKVSELTRKSPQPDLLKAN